MPNAASIRERVIFMRPSVLAGEGDGAGNFEGGLRPLFGARWAEISPVPSKGGESVIAGRLQAVRAFDVWVRFDSETRTLTEGDVVVDEADDTRIFNIRWVGNPDMRRRWLLLQCEQGVAT